MKRQKNIVVALSHRINDKEEYAQAVRRLRLAAAKCKPFFFSIDKN